MDVDGDVDGSLAQALSCMATSDKEVLVRQFQQILGQNHVLTPEACAFFLDMNNWYVHALTFSHIKINGALREA